MALSGELMTFVRADIIKTIRFLQKQNQSYSLATPELIAAAIYDFYSSHATETIKEIVPIIQYKLTKAVQGIQALHRFEEQEDGKLWRRFYSWKLSEDPHEAIIDSCTVRIYLNPKLEYYDSVVMDLMKFYCGLPIPRTSPLMFKFLDPNHIGNNFKFMEKADKVILYANPSNRLVERLQARLISYPENYFNNAVPLFCRKIRNGVGIAYEPKEKSTLVNILRRVLNRNEVYLSYGQFMSYAIAVGIRSEIINQKIRKDTETINFTSLSNEQVQSITVKTLVFVFNRMKEDLHL